MITEKAQFFRIHPNVKLPEYKTLGSCACDLYNPKDFSLQPQEAKLIPTGLVCIPPRGFYWEVVLRSSTYKKWPGVRLVNCVGILDEDFVGPEDQVHLFLENTGSKPLHFKKDDRICQMLLRQVIRPSSMEEIDYGTIANRQSRGGFGSTK